MKQLRLISLLVVLTSFSSFVKAQKFEDAGYCTLNYWGRNIKLDRNFFEILNVNYRQFMNNTAPNWKWYDYNDYSDIYIKDVENLKSPQFTIIVTEANQLHWNNPINIVPGSQTEKGRSKKSNARAVWILYNVILPSLQQYYKFINERNQ